MKFILVVFSAALKILFHSRIVKVYIIYLAYITYLFIFYAQSNISISILLLSVYTEEKKLYTEIAMSNEQYEQYDQEHRGII